MRSAKEKRYEELHNLMKSIRNSKKIKDFYKMETSFQELCKAYNKAKPVIAKEENGVTPIFYLRILVEIEDLVNETWEDRIGRKAMSKNNAKSLGSLRQKLRKYKKEEEMEPLMEKFRENPDQSDGGEKSEAEDVSDASDNEESTRKSFSKSRESSELPDSKSKSMKPGGGDSDSDDSYWDSSESDSSSSDDAQLTNAAAFLKKPDHDLKKANHEKKREKRRREMMKAARDSESEEEDGEKWTVVKGGVEKPKMFEKDAEINHELVVKKLHEIMAARGKKGTNRKEQIELLTELYGISEEHNLGTAIYCKIQFAIVAAIFDYNAKISAAMKPEYWEKCMPNIEKLMTMLTENAEDLTTGEAIMDDQESYEEKPYKIRGCYLTVVERMDEEFIKVIKYLIKLHFFFKFLVMKFVLGSLIPLFSPEL